MSLIKNFSNKERKSSFKQGAALSSFRKLLPFLDWILLIIYAAACLVIVLHHEPWSDEAQPWLMARDMSFKSLIEALDNNYDRHPAAWYLVLFALNKLHLPYLSMSIVNFLFAFGAAALFLFKAPFPRWLKYTFLFSYHIIYEYPVISRPYALTMFLIFLSAFCYGGREKRPLIYGLVVMALFNASYITMGFPFALTALYALEIWKKKEWSFRRNAALFLMVFGALTVYMQGANLPVDHIDYGKKAAYIPQWFFLSRSFFPFFYAGPDGLTYVLGAGIIIAAFLGLIKRPAALFTLFMSYALLFFIFKFRHWGDLRHYGFVGLILLAVYWIDFLRRRENGEGPEGKEMNASSGTAQRRKTPMTRLIRTGVIAALVASYGHSILYAYYACKLDYYAIFSGGRHMADMINTVFEQFKLDRKSFVIAAYPHTTTVAILPYMPGQKFWTPTTGDFETYYLNVKQTNDSLRYDDVLKRIEAAFPDMSNVFVLLDTKLINPHTDRYYYNLMIDMTPHYVFGYKYEKFYLYRAVEKNS